MASNAIANVQYAMGGHGTIINDTGCGTILFFTHISTYEVTFGSFGAYKIERASIFDSKSETVLFNGTLAEVVNTLAQLGPFLN